MKKYLCWHFLQDDKRLRWGNRALVTEGKTCRATGKLKLCHNGMHGSEEICDALDYAPGSVICLVEIWGGVHKDSDKLVGRNRKTLKMIDGEKILREFARVCALRAVRKYWKDAPNVVIRYLETGDESISAAAWDATCAAARAATYATVSAAAWDAASATAWDAASAAASAAARAATCAAARDAAWDATYATVSAAAWDAASAAVRDTICAAVRDAARAAVRAAARAAVRDAAWAATYATVSAAAWDAASAAARAAAWDATCAAARAAQNRLLRIMVKKEMGIL